MEVAILFCLVALVMLVAALLVSLPRVGSEPRGIASRHLADGSDTQAGFREGDQAAWIGLALQMAGPVAGFLVYYLLGGEGLEWDGVINAICGFCLALLVSIVAAGYTRLAALTYARYWTMEPDYAIRRNRARMALLGSAALWLCIAAWFLI